MGGILRLLFVENDFVIPCPDGKTKKTQTRAQRRQMQNLEQTKHQAPEEANKTRITCR